MKKIENSPTLMTLFSLSSRPLSLILITPLLLTCFSAEEIALWYLLGTFINLQSIADFGFYNTFVRALAYSFSGGCTTVKDMINIESKERKVEKVNVDFVGSIMATMIRTYHVLSFILFLLLLLLTVTVYKNISYLQNPIEGWMSWICVICFSVINFQGRKYSNFLLARNHVALVRKWEGVFNLIALFVKILAIYTYKSIFLLVFCNQVWVLVNVLRNRYLANNIDKQYKYSDFCSYCYDKDIMACIWPQAWKSGVSSFITQGIVSASGLIYAQFCTAAQAGSYLFLEKIYTTLRSFAQAPFYSKIPLLVYSRGQKKIKEWNNVAQRGMLLSSLFMVVGIIIFDCFGEPLLKIIGSNIDFPSHQLCILLGWAYFFHRYGAMHTQLYSTINKVNSHISDFVSGLIMIFIWLCFINKLGVYVFPIGMLGGYLLFYVWYAGYYSYKVISISPLLFEIKANLIPALILLIYSCFVLLNN